MICGVFIRFRAKLGEKKAAVLADGCFRELLLCLLSWNEMYFIRKIQINFITWLILVS